MISGEWRAHFILNRNLEAMAVSTAQWTKHYADMAAGKLQSAPTYMVGRGAIDLDQIGGGSDGVVKSAISSTPKRGIKRKRPAQRNTQRKKRRTVNTTATTKSGKVKKTKKKPRGQNKTTKKTRAKPGRKGGNRKGHTGVFF